jgi:hypothetical protein
MAHIAKYKATSVGHMLAHYRRDASSMERDNIDPKRVKNDMVVGHYTNKDGRLVVGRVVPREGEPNWGTVERRIERVNEAQKAAGKRATRKDAVVMADVVVTLPDNVRKGDEDRFFRLTYWYLSNKFGIDNMMGGFVHKDEVLKDGTPARDHMHVPFTPILDGRFNYKKMISRYCSGNSRNAAVVKSLMVSNFSTIMKPTNSKSMSCLFLVESCSSCPMSKLFPSMRASTGYSSLPFFRHDAVSWMR